MICTRCKHMTRAKTCAVFLEQRGGIWWCELARPEKCRYFEQREPRR